VVGELFDLVSEPVGSEPFEGFHNTGVEGAPPLLEETLVHHLLGMRA
jgi:hypothetical protein